MAHRAATLRLSDVVRSAAVVAYREDTSRLERTLSAEGFAVSVHRQPFEAPPGWSPAYLAMIAHHRIWENVRTADEPTLVVEADFVPVRGMGRMPPPFDPHDPAFGIAYLYTCASRLMEVDDHGYAFGYANSAVAYVVTPQGARTLHARMSAEKPHHPPTEYVMWDPQFWSWVVDAGLHCYLPYRLLGEHGGRPNPEHVARGFAAWHRADVLAGPLAFEPIYAAGPGPVVSRRRARLAARAKGLARLLAGRYLTVDALRRSEHPLRLVRFAVGRQLTLRL